MHSERFHRRDIGSKLSRPIRFARASVVTHAGAADRLAAPGRHTYRLRARMMSVIGVDGCRSGWLAVRSQSKCECECEIRVLRTIREVWTWSGGEALILIDVPVGLSDSGKRLCDSEARRRLGFPRNTSVFSPPVRRALFACGWRDAADVNERFTGRRISQQAWGIAPKIREVDEFLRANPQRQGRFREVHPELLFWSLNGQRAMRMPKRQTAGRAERLACRAPSLRARATVVTRPGRGGGRSYRCARLYCGCTRVRWPVSNTSEGAAA